MSRAKRDLTFIAGLALLGGRVAAMAIQGFESDHVAIDARTLTLRGEGLDGLLEARLVRGDFSHPLTSLSLSNEEAVFDGDFLRLECGGWSLVATGPDGEIHVPYCLRLWRPNTLRIVDAVDSAVIPWPLDNSAGAGILDVLLLPGDIPSGGGPLRFHLDFASTPTTAFSGSVRWRSSGGATALASDLSQSTGWLGSETLSSISASGSTLVLSPSGAPALPAEGCVLSFTLTRTGASGGVPMLSEAEPSFRSRTATAVSALPPPTDWDGSYPVSRELHSARPGLSFRYAGPATIAPGFALPVTQVQVGVAIQITNTTTPAPTVARWDFNGDGRIDSTVLSPSVSWSVPGVYTIELVTSAGQTTDSFRWVDCIEVIPAPDGGASTFAIY